MRVKDLISDLKQYPPDKEIFFGSFDGGQLTRVGCTFLEKETDGSAETTVVLYSYPGIKIFTVASPRN